MRDSLSLGLIILLSGVIIGFGGGWWGKGLTIAPHADTVRVEIPVKPSESILDSSAHIEPVIKYVRWEDHRRIDSLGAYVAALLARADSEGTDFIPVAVLDTTLTRYEVTADTTYTLADTFHAEYVFPPISEFRNISLRHAPYEIRRDTVLRWEEVTGFQIFRDGKYIIIGAVATLAAIELIQLLKP